MSKLALAVLAVVVLCILLGFVLLVAAMDNQYSGDILGGTVGMICFASFGYFLHRITLMTIAGRQHRAACPHCGFRGDKRAIYSSTFPCPKCGKGGVLLGDEKNKDKR